MRILLVLLALASAVPAQKWAITVNASDQILPQVADGQGWKTTITVVNMAADQAPFSLRFWTSAGSSLVLPIAGVGRTNEVVGSLPLGGSRVIETEGTSETLLQGWGELESSLKVSGMAVFRSRAAGRNDSEAVVPFCSRYDNRFLLPFDNTSGFVTSVALVNPGSSGTATVFITFRDELGRPLLTGSLTLSPRNHTAFALPDQFKDLIGRRGVADFQTSLLTLSALGLRFSPAAAFTSVHTLSY